MSSEGVAAGDGGETHRVATWTGAGDLPGPRPQPLGTLPWPAGMLVVPDVAGAGALTATLVAGGDPDAWPEGTQFVASALEGNVEAAAAGVAGDDAVAVYNRAVLVGGDDLWEHLAATTTGELRALVDTARFSLGLVDEPPAAAGTVGEVEAVVRSARASAALEAGALAAALDELDAAATAAADAGTPLLAASLRGTRAELQREQLGAPEAAILDATTGLGLIPQGAAPELRADLLVTRALARQQTAGQDRAPLMTVVADLQEALRTFREDTHPEQFAICNQHLALAYLVMPMGEQADKIRIGTAVTSLRAALRVFTPQTHPVAWASAQLNLANALQYLPSVHQEQNLEEAVQLYEEVLQYRTEEDDPIGTARILANQGNALGHLGAFGDARERLTRARDLFARVGDEETAGDVDGLLAELDAAEAAARSSAPGTDSGDASEGGA